jgi:ATP-dependent helicase/nuclease subunit B
MDERGVDRREAVVLVPFVQLIDPLRRTLAAGGGWMPRVETARTLAESLGPTLDAPAGAPTLSPSIDRLIARKLLLGQRWGAEWSRRDGLGFDQAIGRLVATVHELLQAMAATPPGRRATTWTELEGLLPASGRRERDLAAIAVRWAAMAAPPRTDALFALRPSAWIAIEAGGADALVEALRAEGVAPSLTLVLDPPEGAPFDWPAARRTPPSAPAPASRTRRSRPRPRCWSELAAGRRPVALVAHDRLLVRRVHELLVRSGAQVVDETGWRLSTTRAAAGFMALLNSARHDAGNDALLDWLKSGTRWGRTTGTPSRRSKPGSAAPASRGSPAWRPCRCTTPPPSACATTRSRCCGRCRAWRRRRWPNGSRRRSRRCAPAAACRSWPTTRRARSVLQALLLDLEPETRRAAWPR